MHRRLNEGEEFQAECPPLAVPKSWQLEEEMGRVA